MLEIRNLNSYVKVQDFQNRQAAAKKKPEQEDSSAPAKETRKDDDVDIGVMVIASKLNRGQSLTGGELIYLRRKNPALCRKAEAVEAARKKLEKQLKSCKSKQEACTLRSSVSQGTAYEGGLEGSSGDSGMLYQALDAEWNHFMQSKQFKRLPERKIHAAHWKKQRFEKYI